MGPKCSIRIIQGMYIPSLMFSKKEMVEECNLTVNYINRQDDCITIFLWQVFLLHMSQEVLGNLQYWAAGGAEGV